MEYCKSRLKRLWCVLVSAPLWLTQVASADTPNTPAAASSLLSGIPIAAAILAAVIAYGFNIRLEKRKAELKFISDQLQYLYGPMMALSHAARQAWGKFREECRPSGPFFDEFDPPTKEELEKWRLWMSEVFMPINLKMEKIIIENAHLLDSKSMPSSFQLLLAHIATYRAVMKKWHDCPISSDTSFDEIVSQNTARLNFPRQLDSEVTEIFNKLKDRQSKLIGTEFSGSD
jgi:hypothetical protein